MISEARTDEDILATRAVMLQLRTALAPGDYLPTVRSMMREGYRLAALRDDAGEVVAVAGFRSFRMLYAGGHILYVDDLSTDGRRRSKGHGRALLDWLKAEARRLGCTQLHLDSGVQREQAHRFYFREGMGVNCLHFRIEL
ncbi:GNAT family N-acetyltransferase [Pseudoxanthomonas daejeonensis]|uniref:GNAT family N-acetyltransferase n=1 Tax=Pseudoxanthomonas daejeonensis TaxID=266062 RepID=A0ABQ6Z6E0_9GAMM|nr:GNAT family N-acetyltransferase [Pseudoxanthomonas daejeonensis]KAF1694109.1 GNAT family N-acetyltransferase [Pseudoxanthomonas daejeonensis]